MYSLVNTYRLTQKNVCHTHLNAHKPQNPHAHKPPTNFKKIVNMNVASRKLSRIEVGTWDVDSLASFAAHVCHAHLTPTNRA